MTPLSPYFCHTCTQSSRPLNVAFDSVDGTDLGRIAIHRSVVDINALHTYTYLTAGLHDTSVLAIKLWLAIDSPVSFRCQKSQSPGGLAKAFVFIDTDQILEHMSVLELKPAPPSSQTWRMLTTLLIL